jgi:serine/threonine protein kinase
MDSYRALRLLADGPARVVLAATDDGLLVVLKSLADHLDDPELLGRFQRRAEIAASIEHPNIARIYDVISEGDTCTVVMEYVSGEELSYLVSRVTRKGGQIPLHVAGGIIDGVAAGLGSAHEGNAAEGCPCAVTHGHLSISEVMVSYDGRVKLLDFGLGKVPKLGWTSSSKRLRHRLRYKSPEQLLGRAFDHRADLYALGVLAWETLTSQPLFDALSEGAIIRDVFETQIPPPSSYRAEIPGEVDRLVMALLHRDPARRLSSAREFRQRFAKAAGLTGGLEEGVARWIAAEFGASHAQRQALEHAARTEAAQPAAHAEGDLPLAFPELVSAPRHPSEGVAGRNVSRSSPSLAAQSVASLRERVRHMLLRKHLLLLLATAFLVPLSLVVIMRSSGPAGSHRPRLDASRDSSTSDRDVAPEVVPAIDAVLPRPIRVVAGEIAADAFPPRRVLGPPGEERRLPEAVRRDEVTGRRPRPRHRNEPAASRPDIGSPETEPSTGTIETVPQFNEPSTFDPDRAVDGGPEQRQDETNPYVYK